MYEGPFDFRLLTPQQLANLLPPTPVRTTSEPPVPGVSYPSSTPMVPTEVPSPTPVKTIPAVPTTATPVSPPTLPLPSTAIPAAPPATTGTITDTAKKDDPFYKRALDWANSQQGKTSLAALAKGAGGNNMPAPPPPFRTHTSGGSAGGGVEGQLGNLRSQGANMIAEIIKQGRGKLGGGKRRKASDRYDILARGGD